MCVPKAAVPMGAFQGFLGGEMRGGTQGKSSGFATKPQLFPHLYLPR